MLKQSIKFALVGISSGAVNFLAYNGTRLLLHWLGLLPSFDYLIAELAGFIFSVLWSYLLNRKFVFTDPENQGLPWYRVLLKMYAIYSITGIGFNFLLSVLWVEVLGIPEEIITIINDILGFPITFLLNKFWAFRKAKTRTSK